MKVQFDRILGSELEEERSNIEKQMRLLAAAFPKERKGTKEAMADLESRLAQVQRLIANHQAAATEEPDN